MKRTQAQQRGVYIGYRTLKIERQRLLARYEQLAGICKELLVVSPGAGAIEDLVHYDAIFERLRLTLELHKHHGQ